MHRDPPSGRKRVYAAPRTIDVGRDPFRTAQPPILAPVSTGSENLGRTLGDRLHHIFWQGQG